jgi:hypothetical protein
VRTAIASLAATLVACSAYSVNTTRIGAVYAPRTETTACPIRFENLTFAEASSKYEGIGMVSVSGASGTDLTGAMKHDVEMGACHIGGDAVSLNASGPGFFQFMVWRAR